MNLKLRTINIATLLVLGGVGTLAFENCQGDSASAIDGSVAVKYHIDSVLGDDELGLGSEAAPWKTLSKINELELSPGDHVLLKRGSVFRERLSISQSGSMDRPIQIDAYGVGVDPVVSAGHLIPRMAKWLGPNAAGEFKHDLGIPTEFYSSLAVLVRGGGAGIDSYMLLARGIAGELEADSYALVIEGGRRTVYYKPPTGMDPLSFDFEISKRNFAVQVTGDWVQVNSINAVLGNVGHRDLDPPVVEATVYSTGRGVVFNKVRSAFGRSIGISVFGLNSVIRNSLAEHNHSTGLYIMGSEAIGSIIEQSIVRYNGNLESGDLDRGGIGVQSDHAIISRNIVHDNGNLDDLEGPRIGGDDALSLSDCAHALIEHNVFFNSARSAIGMSYTYKTYGHRILDNIIVNWNLINQEGTLRTMAIHVSGYGYTPNAGRVTIWNNTIFSDQSDATLIGIQLAVPSNQDTLQNTSVANNVIYMPNNNNPESVGLRLTRSHLFENVEINNNNVYLPQTSNHYRNLHRTFLTAADFAELTTYEAAGSNANPKLNVDVSSFRSVSGFDFELAN